MNMKLISQDHIDDTTITESSGSNSISALSGILWNSSNQNKGDAKFQYGTACAWLDELNANY